MDPVRIPLHIIPQDSYDRELYCFHTDNEQARDREREREWGRERWRLRRHCAEDTTRVELSLSRSSVCIEYQAVEQSSSQPIQIQFAPLFEAHCSCEILLYEQELQCTQLLLSLSLTLTLPLSLSLSPARPKLSAIQKAAD